MNNGYLTFIGAVTILFVMAKLLGLITWSWWLVFSPVIILAVFAILMFAVFGMTVVILVIEERKKEAKKNGSI